MYPVKINEPVNQVKHHSLLQRPIVSVKLNGLIIDMLADSSAMINLVSLQHVSTFLTNILLQPSYTNLMICGRQSLQCH